MNRKVIGVVAAVLLAAVGTAVLVVYVKSAERRALAGERLVEVLVVQDTVGEGTPAEELAGRLSTEQVPVKVEARGAVADLDELDGKVAAVDLVAGEQLVSGRFVDPGDFTAQGAVEVPEGLQEVTVSLEPQRAVGGQLSPGDTVGFFASFEPDVMIYSTHLNLHKLLVTNLQGDPQPAAEDGEGDAGEGDDDDGDPVTSPPNRDPAPGDNLLVTLAVNAADAEKVVFAAEHGTVWLSAEPEDATEDGTQVQTPETIYE